MSIALAPSLPCPGSQAKKPRQKKIKGAAVVVLAAGRRGGWSRGRMADGGAWVWLSFKPRAVLPPIGTAVPCKPYGAGHFKAL